MPKKTKITTKREAEPVVVEEYKPPVPVKPKKEERASMNIEVFQRAVLKRTKGDMSPSAVQTATNEVLEEMGMTLDDLARAAKKQI